MRGASAERRCREDDAVLQLSVAAISRNHARGRGRCSAKHGHWLAGHECSLQKAAPTPAQLAPNSEHAVNNRNHRGYDAKYRCAVLKHEVLL
jgi:hypothetical protein